MTKEFIYQFIQHQKLAVLATCTGEVGPEAAVVGIAVTRELEIVFDTVTSSRKYVNLQHNPHVALVIGWDNETTVQYEGIAAELNGEGSSAYKETYFDAFPDGRERAETWAGLVHFKVTPKWLRYSNFNDPVVIEEMSF